MLEHLERPAAALARIAHRVAPGGGLLLGVPNLDSWQARLGGGRWFHLDVPRHRTHFTVAGVSYLYNLLKRNAPPTPRDLAITVAAVGLAPVAGLAELLAGWAGHGGTIAVLARRR